MRPRECMQAMSWSPEHTNYLLPELRTSNSRFITNVIHKSLWSAVHAWNPSDNYLATAQLSSNEPANISWAQILVIMDLHFCHWAHISYTPWENEYKEMNLHHKNKTRISAWKCENWCLANRQTNVNLLHILNTMFFKYVYIASGSQTTIAGMFSIVQVMWVHV